MLKVLNIIFWIYFILGTIIVLSMDFFPNFGYKNELMLLLTIVALSLRLIILYLEKNKNKDQK